MNEELEETGTVWTRRLGLSGGNVPGERGDRSEKELYYGDITGTRNQTVGSLGKELGWEWRRSLGKKTRTGSELMGRGKTDCASSQEGRTGTGWTRKIGTRSSGGRGIGTGWERRQMYGRRDWECLWVGAGGGRRRVEIATQTVSPAE